MARATRVMLPVSPDTIYAELESAIEILKKWHTKVGAGVPGMDLPTSDPSAIEAFFRELQGEVMLVSGKCANLATILGEGL